jgi:hypothetical protein
MAERRASDPMREVTFTTVQVTQPCFVEVATAACTLAQARWPRVALQELADTCCQVPRSGEANGRRFYRMPCHPDDGATLQLLADMAEAAMFKRFREGLGEAIKSGALRT